MKSITLKGFMQFINEGEDSFLTDTEIKLNSWNKIIKPELDEMQVKFEMVGIRSSHTRYFKWTGEDLPLDKWGFKEIVEDNLSRYFFFPFDYGVKIGLFYNEANSISIFEVYNDSEVFQYGFTSGDQSESDAEATAALLKFKELCEKYYGDIYPNL